MSQLKDVSSSSYFYDAVNWAVRKGITSGTSATTFSPYQPCTRAQIVKFIYKMAGSPDVSDVEIPFSDVPSNAYYLDAVKWAVSSGVTSGTSKTTFSPNKPCTRGQIVTFLWKYNKAPEVDATVKFSDVESTAYYAEAVKWAVANNVTSGTSATTFSPNVPCTRAQAVTFLYKSSGEK